MEFGRPSFLRGAFSFKIIKNKFGSSKLVDTFAHMGTQKATKKKDKPNWENVKLPTETVTRLRKHKRETLIPIGQFVVAAINEKLQREKD